MPNIYRSNCECCGVKVCKSGYSDSYPDDKPMVEATIGGLTTKLCMKCAKMYKEDVLVKMRDMFMERR